MCYPIQLYSYAENKKSAKLKADGFLIFEKRRANP